MNAREFLRAMYEAIAGEYPHRQPAPMELLQLARETIDDLREERDEAVATEEENDAKIAEFQNAEGKADERIEELEAELEKAREDLRLVTHNAAKMRTAIDAINASRIELDDYIYELESAAPKEEAAS